jgi:hypothetical protein
LTLVYFRIIVIVIIIQSIGGGFGVTTLHEWGQTKQYVQAFMPKNKKKFG